MSIISDIANAVGVGKTKAPATVADIEQKIADAQVRIVQLQRDHARACLAWADNGDASDRDRLSDELAAARVDLAALSAALAMAKERNGQDERRRLAALNASRLSSMTQHLRAAEKAAAELADAVAKAATARAKLLEKSAKARASAPSPLPKGSLTEAGVLNALIANEMHRVSWDAKSGGMPGAKAPTLSVKEKPEAIVPLVDQLRQAHDFAINVVKGEIAIERTPLVAAEIASGEAKAAALADTVIAEPADFNPADLLPGVRSAQEIQASIPRVKLNLDDKG